MRGPVLPAPAPHLTKDGRCSDCSVQAMLAGAKPLYATLSDDQKKVADELMAEHLMTMRARGM